jgi:hypothetical protein
MSESLEVGNTVLDPQVDNVPACFDSHGACHISELAYVYCSAFARISILVLVFDFNSCICSVSSGRYFKPSENVPKFSFSIFHSNSVNVTELPTTSNFKMNPKWGSKCTSYTVYFMMQSLYFIALITSYVHNSFSTENSKNDFS